MNQFAEEWKYRPVLSGSFKNVGNSASFEQLEAEYSENEICVAIIDFNRNKALGPNGFNLLCFQKFWNVIIHEWKYRPVLSGSFKNVGNSASFEQLEAEYSENEICVAIIDFNRNKALGPNGFNLLCFQKFWNVIKHEIKMDFLDERMSLVSTSRMLVNGSPTQEFSPQKGLKQGDPLSPPLFNLVAEGLNILMLKERELGLLKGVEIGSKGVVVSHLQFADDSLCFCESN
ncbi:uncharacterized protein LOC114258163 [Camellia sinensis]|uniref:uncharacterized protein LOC114258163 n=1 Tax=Camellia sinensis TaxID=4442 RepID=UPI0010357C94|nr:uncharacterized protein LOC114258163 [Camellia sinensis]